MKFTFAIFNAIISIQIIIIAGEPCNTDQNQVFSWIEMSRRTCEFIPKTQKRYTFLFRPGCYCKDGFFWNSKSQQCVTLRNCFPPGQIYDEIIVSSTNLRLKPSSSNNGNSSTPRRQPQFPRVGNSTTPLALALFRQQEQQQQILQRRQQEQENLITASATCANEEEYICGCRITCGRLNEKCVVCTEGCHCRLGFAYDERTRRCVPKQEC